MKSDSSSQDFRSFQMDARCSTNIVPSDTHRVLGKVYRLETRIKMVYNCIQLLDWNVRRKKVLLLDQGRAPGWSRRSPAKSCLVLFSHERTIKITHEASSAIRRHHAGYVGFEAFCCYFASLYDLNQRSKSATILTLQDRGTGLSVCEGCGREEEIAKRENEKIAPAHHVTNIRFLLLESRATPYLGEIFGLGASRFFFFSLFTLFTSNA